ncbi:MAG: prolyl oligopeptidase family serine peptidase [Candidatus Hydrogenedentales bacterium]
MDLSRCLFTILVVAGLMLCVLGQAKAEGANVNAPRSDAFYFPMTGVSVAREAVLLAIDDVSLPLRSNLHCSLTKPTVLAEPVLTPSRENPNAPDYLATHFYGTVLHDQDTYRMWYYACHTGRNPDWPDALKAQAARWKEAIIPGPLCYAESADGIHWQKPNLDQLMFKGSRANNAFDLPSALTGDACVIKDEDDPDPARRYKLAFWSQFDPFEFPTMRIATSSDGIFWNTAPKPPISSFLEHASFYTFNGYYFANSQTLQARVDGGSAARVGTAWISPDFDHWLGQSAESFALPYVANPERDEVHLGIGAGSLGNVLVGLYCIWHNNPDFGKISGDFGLVVSNDGLFFREPEKGHVWLKADESPATPIPGMTLPTVLCQANGILNVGDETRIYHGRWRNSDYGKPGIPPEDYWGEVALATLPRDRWGGLSLLSGEQDGYVWSTPVTLPATGCDMFINGEGLEAVSVELADDRFALLPGLSDAGAGMVPASAGFDCPVTWPGGNLHALGGRTVRFKVRLKGATTSVPRVYALYLRPAADVSSEATTATATEFDVQAGGRSVTARLLSPPQERLAADPALLLTFCSDRFTSSSVKPYCLPAEGFLAHGHRVVSFDLPMHGERVGAHGAEIAGLRNAFVAGEDPFAMFVEDGKAVISECIQRGWARPGRIAVSGTSRGGYMALRLLAADERIAAGAGFAPVTDWSVLTEFAADRDREDVKGLWLSHFAHELAGRNIYIAIGSHDNRVDTQRCQQFYADLCKANEGTQHSASCVEFHVTEDKGHSMGDASYSQGRESLLKWIESAASP